MFKSTSVGTASKIFEIPKQMQRSRTHLLLGSFVNVSFALPCLICWEAVFTSTKTPYISTQNWEWMGEKLCSARAACQSCWEAQSSSLLSISGKDYTKP